MVALSSVLVALCGATTIIANPINMENSPENLITRPASTRSGNGTHDGFFYHFWLDGEGSVNYTNEVNFYHKSFRPLTSLTS
jgi:endo-1,4-beta-xylanase